MALRKEIKYSYNDIGIVPAITSDVEHRKDCDPLIDGKLPLFTAPMSSVVDEPTLICLRRMVSMPFFQERSTSTHESHMQ